MSEPFLGEIRIMSFGFAPKGWAMCNGGLLTINQNQALFSLLGTMYGGNGQTTFALPDFQGRTGIHVGAGYTQGQSGGENAHTLTVAEMPGHTHNLSAAPGLATSGATATPPAGNSLAQAYAVQQGGATTPVNRFSSSSPSGTLNAATVGNVGASQPHENRQPYLALNFCIALQGIFPSPN